MFQTTKDPNETVDYIINYNEWLNGDIILSSVWIVPSGITSVSSSNTSSTATIWLSGGTLGATYIVTNRTTTAAGRIVDRSIRIVMVNH